MPSHTSEASIGAVLCGDGRWLTARDRRGNALADHHAKECAKSASVDEGIRRHIDQQIATSTDGAKWMALITAEANAYRGSGGKVTRDSEGLAACQKRVRELRPAAKARKDQGAAAAKSAPST